MSVEKLTAATVNEETKIEEIADNLYKRIDEETNNLLKSQIKAMGDNPENHDVEDLVKTIFPDDEKALALYEYKGVKILGLRIGESSMSIEFDVPELKDNPETQNKGEVHNV